MQREDKTEVLVVGAGPVGMLTALLLAEAGVAVKMIDGDERTATQSYACALHPRSLEILDQAGLAAEVLAMGRPIETLGFYEGPSRRAEIKLSELGGEFPFALVLPQSALENVLERALSRKAQIKVDWNHRLTDLVSENNTIRATIDKMGESAKGYGVTDWDWEVEKTLETRTMFLVGADGHNSLVRQRLAIDYEPVGPPESFAVCEFESDVDAGHEMRVVLTDKTTDVFWPILDRRCRWSFQVNPTEQAPEFPHKERMDVHVEQLAADEETRKQVQKFVQQRAPWFSGGVKQIDWSTDVHFERRLANRFGQGNCWLVGDAAHQTSPVGMQSMNVGLNEAAELALVLKRILREKAPLSLLETYDGVSRSRWQQLFGMESGPTARTAANPWAKQHCAKFLPCIPASGENLAPLLSQLGLDFQSM